MQTTSIDPTTALGNGGDGISDVGARARQIGRQAARSITDVAETVMQRVRDRDLGAALSDVRRIVQERPGAALLAAAVLGFVLARSLSRR